MTEASGPLRKIGKYFGFIPVVDKYVSLIPLMALNSNKKNFCLRSLEKPKPAQWYSVKSIDKHTLAKVVGKLLKDAKLDRFFSNHSL